MTYFPSHSYEQYYQCIRRCYRFGQKRPVNIDLVYTQGDENIISNLERKKIQAEEMMDKLVQEMKNSLDIRNIQKFDNRMEVPTWL
jgi:SNF2 family DNA or RNA helicase